MLWKTPSRRREGRTREPGRESLETFLPAEGHKSVMFSMIRAFSVLMLPSTSDMQSAGYWLEKGNELCNSGQAEEALKAYDQALGIDATLIDAWNNKGLVLASLERFALALQCFEEALKLSPRHKHALSNMGMVLAQQKKYPEALGCFDAAIAIDPYFAGAWFNKALAMQCLGRGKEAMAAMKTAKTLDGEARSGCCGLR
jgi:tetratricopeptide (TPR) repeat protein